ncbi:hypothetical protein EXS71_03550 [Candidatus Uhrbacteria bacterium]|nr:hypothetical protein [Candidatus Uhrbacteria bacterium]
MGFVHKSVNSSGHIGADLIELRERAGWTRQQIAAHTKIDESLIRAWEEEHLGEILDPIYAERLLRVYVNFLHGQENYFIQKYRSCLREHHLERKPEELLPRPRYIRGFDLATLSRTLTIGGFILFALLLGGYVYFQVRTIGTPPPLQVDQPLDESRVPQPNIQVSGKTASESSVTINGQQAIVQPDGTFSMEINIPRGTTLITIIAKRRHGHEATVTKRVVYDRPLPSVYEVTTSTAR